MTKNMTDKERRKRLRKNKTINAAIRSAKGTEVTAGGSVPKANKEMSSFIREDNEATPEDKDAKLRRKKVAAVAEGYILGDDGEILHDIREGA